jgi:hypothetical protein
MADSASGTSEKDQAPPTGFHITSEDANILQEYLEEFEHAETAIRTRLVEKAMAELYMLQPPNPVFDKADARKVCTMVPLLLFHTLTDYAIEN